MFGPVVIPACTKNGRHQMEKQRAEECYGERIAQNGALRGDWPLVDSKLELAL